MKKSVNREPVALHKVIEIIAIALWREDWPEDEQFSEAVPNDWERWPETSKQASLCYIGRSRSEYRNRATAALRALSAAGWTLTPPKPIASSGTLDPETKREWDIQGQLGQWVTRAKPSTVVITKAICAHYDEYTPKCLFATRNWSTSCSPRRCVDCPDMERQS